MTLSLHLFHKNNIDNIPSNPITSAHYSVSSRAVAVCCKHDTPIFKTYLPICAELLSALNLSHARPTPLDIGNPN